MVPRVGSVPAFSEITANVIYSPNWGGKQDEENIALKLENGTTQYLKCIGFCNDSKTIILQKNIDFGNVPIASKIERLISLKNVNKFSTVFSVGKSPNCTEISPMKGKIGADSVVNLKVL